MAQSFKPTHSQVETILQTAVARTQRLWIGLIGIDGRPTAAPRREIYFVEDDAGLCTSANCVVFKPIGATRIIGFYICNDREGGRTISNGVIQGIEGRPAADHVFAPGEAVAFDEGKVVWNK